MKNCAKCKLEKTSVEFQFIKSTGKLASYCKQCRNKITAEYQIKNKDKIRLKQKRYDDKNKEKKIKRNQVFKEKNPQYHKNKEKEYLKNNINYKLSKTLRTRLYGALKNTKVGSAVKDLGCTIAELKQYIESKFVEGMTWENWGNKEGCWSVDHIIPLSKLDLQNPEQFKIANHYTNLQPLWHIDNLKKGNKI